MSIPNGGQDLNLSDSQNYSMNTTRTMQDKRVMKIIYLENENKNLINMIEDLQTTLKINKGIIKNLVDSKKGLNQVIEYTFNQLNHENELLENKLKKTVEDRDSLHARVLILQQINEDTKDKEDDVAEMFKDDIEELKENLERKEYLLQVNEQRYGEYEKILMEISEQDAGVRKRLAELNLVPRDRKISNVILENTNNKNLVEELKIENGKLRDQLEQIISNGGAGMQQEELSIFQVKNPHNMPKLDLNKLQYKEQPDQREYIKKLEQSVQYLNDKIAKNRADFKNLKKENQNLKDSNENHIFINEKLNQALKKSAMRLEEMEKKLEAKGIDPSTSSNNDKKQEKKQNLVTNDVLDSSNGNQQTTATTQSQQEPDNNGSPTKLQQPIEMINSNTKSKQQPQLSQQQQHKAPVMGGMKGQKEQALHYESSFGDMSSIMIMPDQLYKDFNLIEDEADAAQNLPGLLQQSSPQKKQNSSQDKSKHQDQ